MKYGIIVYNDTQNIGDDIQSYAAAKLLPHVDYYIEREHMDVFRPETNEPVNTIMNGWFMYNKLGWPISPYINPLYISMHFQEWEELLINDDFLKGVGGEDLIENGPVGARDVDTARMLERNGIPAYFSGCMTLTLPKMQSDDQSIDGQSYVCLTDVSQQVSDFLRNKYPDISFKIIEHEPINQPPLVDKTADWETRFKNVESLLAIYQCAQAVVTTRLHCALPCLALGIPVLLIIDGGLEASRFSGLRDLVRTATSSDILDQKIDFDLRKPPINSDMYCVIRDNLIQTVNRFIDMQSKRIHELTERCARYDQEWEKRMLWKDQMILLIKKRHEQQWAEHNKVFAYYEKTIQSHLQEIEILKSLNHKLENENKEKENQLIKLQKKLSENGKDK